MKTILVPTDFSKEAKSALWYALDMALVSKAELVLAHVFHPPIFSPFSYDEATARAELEQKKLQKLHSYAKEIIEGFCNYFTLLSGSSLSACLKEEGTDGERFSVLLDGEKAVTVRLACRYGLTKEEIVRTANLYEADVIVMGMRGSGAISQVLLGSTTIGVIQESEVPVLAVPLQVRYGGLTSVVLAVDPARLPEADTLAPLCDFTAAFGSSLAVLQLYNGANAQEDTARKLDSSERLKTCLPGTGYRLYASRSENVAAGIQQFLEAKQADLLVLVPQKHSFLSRLRNKSITGQMAAKALVPLLALPQGTTRAPALQQQTTMV